MIQRLNEIKEIQCKKCGCTRSKVFLCIDNAGKRECGECTKCGDLTYQIWLDKNPDFGPKEPTVTCPFCHSTDCKKISASAKIGKTLMWGVLAAGTVSKTWHCNNCGSNFG